MNKRVRGAPSVRACPNCGQNVANDQRVCSCGARWVGPPLAASENPLPRLGVPLTALGVVILSLVVEGMLVAREVYLSEYIWTEALARALVNQSKLFVPACGIALAVAVWGVRAARRNPQRYGGRRLGRMAAALALGVIVLHTAVFTTQIPRLLENGRIKRLAATRANLYHLARAIEAYKEQYGTYPRRLLDLQEMDPNFKPVVDSWGREFVYQTTASVIAGTVGPPPFQNYQLISKGPDGILGTADDIVLQDDILVSPAAAAGETAPDARAAPSQSRTPPRRITPR